MAQDLLLEIGVEELPASFVNEAVKALPKLLSDRLGALRLGHGAVSAGGTPRRLVVTVAELADKQPDLDEEVTGPPARVAFDKDGKPTKAAESFASKNNVELAALYTVEQAKGSYVAAKRVEDGRPALELMPQVLFEVCGAISFRKSMRWSDGDTAFGRPVRWLLALLGSQVVPFSFAGLAASNKTYGHRFLAPQELTITHPSEYYAKLRGARVLVDIPEREKTMNDRLARIAVETGGELIEDAFLVSENASLVEDPQVVAGSFDESFLSLPERVILDVAKDHQRYFGVRGKDGRLLPRYLAVVNTAEVMDNVRRGNDRVMRARLSDAKFFYDEDSKKSLAGRRAELDGVMFQKRLGSVGDKVRRLVTLTDKIATRLGFSVEDRAKAAQVAELCKCDLVTLMVFEFPELQGEMGKAYALRQGVAADVANAIAEHYAPRGASDPTAASDIAAVVALADRLDTLVACCAINVMPTGSADPLALRRASIGILRTLVAKGWRLSVVDLARDAFAGLASIQLDLTEDDTVHKLGGFLRHRLRGILAENIPQDAVDACLDARSDVPYDAQLRASALGKLDVEVRASVGEVFKRAANIGKDATDGPLVAPSELGAEVHASEQALFTAFAKLQEILAEAKRDGDYPSALGAIGEFAPTLGQYFLDVFVMSEDLEVRNNRLRLMRAISSSCSDLASFNLLAR